jgi:hypothetical protein
MYEWLQTGFGLVIIFIEHFDTTRDHALKIIVTRRLVSQCVTISTRRCSVVASNCGRSPFSGSPNCPRPQLPAFHSNSSQKLNPSGYLTHQTTQLSHSPIDSIPLTDCSQTCPDYNIHALTAWKTSFSLLLYPLVNVELLRSCVLAEPLPRNSCCIVAYFAAVAWQRLHIP